MVLPEKLYQGIMKSCGSLHYPHTPQGDPRRGAAVEILVYRTSKEGSPESTQGKLKAVVSTGLTMLYGVPMPVGEKFITELPEGPGKTVLVLCAVTQWYPVSRDCFTIQATFEQVLPPRPSNEEDIRRAVLM